MIIMTSDIHHQSLQTENQKHSDLTEIKCASIFLEMLKKFNLKGTYYISGLSFKEDWNHNLEKISSSDNIELGGHNWSCFTPEIAHRVFKKLISSYNGPNLIQKRDCLKTKDIILKKTGREILHWRNHMYMHGPRTEENLKACGIMSCSDGVRKNIFSPQKHSSGLFNVPINTIPDHEHIYHAERTKEWVEKWVKRYNWSDDFGSASYSIEKWGEILLSQIHSNERMGIDSVVIIHPITMYLADNFNFIYRALDELKKYEFGTMSDYLIKHKKGA